MLAKAAGVLALLLISVQAQSQDHDEEFYNPYFTCANAPFTYSCPFDRLISIKSISIYASLTDPSPIMAVNNNTCLRDLFSCVRTFKDASDQALRELPEYDYFFKWLHITCNGRQMCNGTMPAPNRLHGINRICSEEEVSYFVAAYVDTLCVTNRTFSTFAPLPETTAATTLTATRLWTNSGDRATSTSVALQVTNPKPTNNLLSAFIDLSWLRNEGLSIHSRQPTPQLCLVSMIILVILFHFEP